MIINPSRLMEENIPAVGFEKLKELVIKASDETDRLLRLLRDDRSNPDYNDNHYFYDLLTHLLKIDIDILMSITMISPLFLNSVFILMRTFLENMVDLFWVYSIYEENNINGNNLAKRFFQIGAQKFINFSDIYKDIARNDPYIILAGDSINIENEKRNAEKKLFLVDLTDSNASRKLQELQRTDWHALPGLVKEKGDISFKRRSDKAKALVINTSNLKAAPFIENWDLLNQYSHPTSFLYSTIDEVVARALYNRTINIILGFIHDMLNICYILLKQNPPPDIIRQRNEFHWFST